MITTKTMIKNKLQELLSELKNFKISAVIFVEYKKRNDCEVFYSTVKLIASYSDIEEAFKSMH